MFDVGRWNCVRTVYLKLLNTQSKNLTENLETHNRILVHFSFVLLQNKLWICFGGASILFRFPPLDRYLKPYCTQYYKYHMINFIISHISKRSVTCWIRTKHWFIDEHLGIVESQWKLNSHNRNLFDSHQQLHFKK